jgi:hypothetical protein
MAKRQAVIDEPVRTVYHLRRVRSIAQGPDLPRTGASRSDFDGGYWRMVQRRGRLKPQEVLVDNTSGTYSHQVSFSETKQRKARYSWVTIRFPSATLRGGFKAVLERCMARERNPCEGLNTDRMKTVCCTPRVFLTQPRFAHANARTTLSVPRDDWVSFADAPLRGSQE